jgi:threonine/homoserine/homoserine lactone efflux protein
MLDLAVLVFYTLGASVIIITPGADFLYVTTRGMAHGPRAGLLSALGISLGLIIHTTLASLGLTALVKNSPLVFDIVKYAGAAYLLYLGVRTLLQGDEYFAETAQRNLVGTQAVFRQGVATNLLNPKALLTFLAFIPQFLQPENGNISLQIALMGLIIAALAVIWFGFIGLTAGRVGTWFKRRPRLAQGIRWLTGSVLVGLGVRLVVAK